MYFAIEAYDAIFQGLHGICDTDICECKTEEEAVSIGLEMAGDVIESYSSAYDSYYDSNEDDEDGTEWYNFINENVDCAVFLIDKVSNEYVIEHLQEMKEQLYNDRKEFLEKYCSDY